MPRATYLGSSPLTTLVRCLCRRRLYLDSALWRLSRLARCDNCSALICHNSLRVISAWERWRKVDEGDMSELAYRRTEERERVLDELKEIERRVVRLAESTSDSQTQYRVRNVAQSAAAQHSLLIQDFHFQDGGSPA